MRKSWPRKAWPRACHVARRALGRPARRRKTVVCHFGFRKAGSTTVQETLRTNAAAIRSHAGLVLRKTDPSIKELRAAGTAYVERPSWATLLDLRMAASGLAREIEWMPQETAIISEENVFGARVTLGDRDIFAMAASVLPVLEEEWRGFDVSFVFYTRERRAWIRSCYNQAVKWHRFPETYGVYLAETEACRSWQEGEAALREVLRSPVRFVPMEDDLAGGGMLGRTLLEAAGVPGAIQAAMTPAAAQNRSPTAPQLELMREINALQLGSRPAQKIARIIERRRDLFVDAEAPPGPHRSAGRGHEAARPSRTLTGAAAGS